MGSTIKQASAGVPHGSISTTTAGAIRKAGGTVELVPELTRGGNLNTIHVNVTGGSKTFGPITNNPVPSTTGITTS